MKTEGTEFESKEKKIYRSIQSSAAFVVGLITFAWQACWVVAVFSNQESFAMMWPPGWALYFIFPLPLIALGIVLGILGGKSLLRKDRVFSKWGIILNCIATIPSVFGALLLFSI